ncbi:Radical SAM domain-containing protein [Gloeomargarita lithophora Alchichica-D10]|uniref:Radical SAM domain-containing protein n=1 Tax=Gloeomargarita lithophora Alchichica-D10 TaxID=1188229 RepID=A0A1J0AD11_9CYAN|nr:[FeFe] hydrogenase H-cluster radical SAM maturase HydE [Gloeomargarita lithophora]APB33800.1 Radical SAM domain-containing protein [Gloeomargarita lithophora Alchichica-D10]
MYALVAEPTERILGRPLPELIDAAGELQQELFAQARRIRQQHQMDQVRLRGVIEISNYCQKNCNYCAMRATNQNLDRYRLSAAEILEIAAEIHRLGIGTLFLQAGQDPECNAILETVIPEAKRHFGLQILLCLGEYDRATYHRWRALGADSYILKFETSEPERYRQIAYTPLTRRLQCIRWLQEAGFQVGTGNIVGLPGQTLDTLVRDILLTQEIQPNFASSSPFIPNENTPFSQLESGSVRRTLNMMAIFRILLPQALVPTVSALEKLETGGQLAGLNAGANVITINFTPPQCRSKYVIYSEGRFVVSLDHARTIINQAGMTVQPVAI